MRTTVLSGVNFESALSTPRASPRRVLACATSCSSGSSGAVVAKSVGLTCKVISGGRGPYVPLSHLHISSIRARRSVRVLAFRTGFFPVRFFFFIIYPLYACQEKGLRLLLRPLPPG